MGIHRISTAILTLITTRCYTVTRVDIANVTGMVMGVKIMETGGCMVQIMIETHAPGVMVVVEIGVIHHAKTQVIQIAGFSKIAT